MNETTDTRPVAPPDVDESPVAESERALRQEAEPYLQKMKQAVLTAIEEAIRKHGSELVGEVRRSLKAAMDGLVAAQVEKLVEQLRPRGDGTRRLAEGWLREMREFASTTVGDLFEQRVPEYSRWAGQRVLDYALVGALFATAAVLLLVGGVLGLREVGVPPYATCLVGGTVALGLGYILSRARTRRPELLNTQPREAHTTPPRV